MEQIGAEASKRIFSWEDAETDSTKDWKNKNKRVTPMPRARPKNVHAKPLKPRPQPEPINTCVENDDWPRAKPAGLSYYTLIHQKKKTSF